MKKILYSLLLSMMIFLVPLSAQAEPVEDDTVVITTTETESETDDVVGQLTLVNQYLSYIFTFLLFLVVVTLCVFTYKFFNIFF